MKFSVTIEFPNFFTIRFCIKIEFYRLKTGIKTIRKDNDAFEASTYRSSKSMFFLHLFINILVYEVYSTLSNTTGNIEVVNISNVNKRKRVREHEL